MTKAAHNVPVAILVGGRATRLQSVAPGAAKPLLEIGGRPFLVWQIEWLRGQGFREIILCVGHRADDFEGLLGTGSAWGVSIRYSRESIPLGTGGAARLAAPMIAADAAVVMNGDTFCRFELASVLERHQAAAASATMVVTHVEDTARYGSVVVDEHEIISAYREKSASTGPGYINAGIYVLNTTLLTEIPEGVPFSLERDFFPKLCGRGLRAHPVEGTFIDIGTPASLIEARTYLTSTMLKGS